MTSFGQAPGPVDNFSGGRPIEDDASAMIRVDHAGEFGAVRIYAGQLAVLGDRPEAVKIRAMAQKEAEHLAAFDKLVAERRVRPTALSPLWNIAGFALGAASAMMGPKAAMACTVAIEEAIEEHYAGQAARLGARDPELRAKIEEFRRDEIAHRDEALAEGARAAAGYPLLRAAIRTGSRLAIFLSTRI